MFSDIFTTSSQRTARRLLSSVPVVLVAAGLSSTAVMAADFEEIVVTATKRATTIQDVPFSINAQTQQDIQRSGATNLEELSRNVASLTIQNLGPGQSQVAIRGVSAGQIIRDQPGVKEQVGVYMDESVISLSLFTPDFDLFDLNRVETLRGPQGTLFGSGSIGGTIRYITNDPDMENFDGSIEANVNTITDGDVGGHIKGMVNIPFADGKAALRAVGYTTEYGGFIDALGEGGTKKNDVDSGSRSGGRLELKYTPTDRVTMTPRIIYQEIDTDGFNRQEAFNLFANPYTTTRPAIQLEERQQYLLLDEGFSDKTFLGDSTIEIGFDNFDVTFVGSYTDREIHVNRDASALSGSVSVSLGYPDSAVLLPSNLRDSTDLTQSTYELRFSSNDDSRLQWLGGIFYADMDRKYEQRLPTPGYQAVTDAELGAGTSAGAANGFPNLDSPYNADIPYNITQFAIFGEVTYDLTDQWHLTAGGRYYDFDEKRSFVSGGLFANGDNETDKTTSDGFNPRILASYDVSEDVTFNAQISQGFRLGGVNDPLNETLCTPDDLAVFGGLPGYKDETLWNYEAGFKARLGGAFTFNAAAFYADMKNLQVTLDAGSCSSRVVLNVPDAHSTGAEFELAGNVTDALAITLAGSIINSEFDSTVETPSGAILGGIENGNRLASVPKFQIAATATYSFPLTIGGVDGEAYLNASFQHIGDRITQPTDQVPGAGNFVSDLPFGGATGDEMTSLDLVLDAYTISNLRAGFVMDSWDFALYIDNLADENANTSFDRERGGRARLGFRTNQPRTVGLTVRKGFGN